MRSPLLARRGPGRHPGLHHAAATGTCRMPRTCSSSVHDAERGTALAGSAWRRRSRPPAAWPVCAQRTEGEAGGGGERRVQRRGPGRDRIAAGGALHVSRRSSRKASRTRIRSRIIGDTEESDPPQWELGGTARPPIHAVLIIHAAVGRRRSTAACRAQRARLSEKPPAASWSCPDSMQRGYRPDGDYEPFGFHDGIAQPAIAGLRLTATRACRPASSSSGIRTTSRSSRRRRWCRRSSTRRRCCRRSSQPVSRVAAAAGSGPQRLVRCLSEAPAGCRRLLAIHEAARPLRAAGAEDMQARSGWRRDASDDGRAGRRWCWRRMPTIRAIGDRDDFWLSAAIPDGLACPLGAHIRRAEPARRRSSRTPPRSHSACPKRIACSVARGCSDRRCSIPLCSPTRPG